MTDAAHDDTLDIRSPLASYAKFALDNGGELLSSEVKMMTTLRFACVCGNLFERLPYFLDRFRTFVWCNYDCSNNPKRYDIGNMSLDIIVRSYRARVRKNNVLRCCLDVTCEAGHKFSITYENLQIGYWCPECTAGRVYMSELLLAKEGWT